MSQLETRTGFGVDIGGSGIKGCVVDLQTGGLVGERFKLSTPQPSTPEAVAAVVAQVVDHFSWTGPLGVTFPAEALYRAGSERVPRSHRPVGAGAGIIEVLHGACRDRDVDIALGTRVDGLLVDDESVHGVTAGGQRLTARAVIITSGGFAQNPELLAEHLPDTRLAGSPIRSPAPPTNRGDGIRMAAAVGAATAGENHGVVLLSPGIVSDIEPFLPGWLVFVDASGQRYINEMAPYSVVTPITLARGGTCWVLIDDEAVRAAKPEATSAWGAGTWVADTLLAAVETGQVVSAPDVEELAARIGVPAPALTATLRRYNEDCAAGCDRHFFKDPAALKPVATAPFYAVRMHPSVVPLTGYGLRIDPDARVLRAQDYAPLRGLYAAGEVSGNVLGPQYLGGGNAVTSAILFGRVGGQTAVADF